MTTKVDAGPGGSAGAVSNDAAAFGAALTRAPSGAPDTKSTNGAEGPVSYSAQGPAERGPAVAFGSGRGATAGQAVAYGGATAAAQTGGGAGAVAYSTTGGRGPTLDTEASAGGALVYSTPRGQADNGPAVVYSQGPGRDGAAVAYNAASTIQQLTTMYNMLRSMIASQAAGSEAQAGAMLAGQVGAPGVNAGLQAGMNPGLPTMPGPLAAQSDVLPTEPGPIESQGGAQGDAPGVDGEGAKVEGPVAVENGRIWGDPHFVGADGGKYDVQGQAGKVYNILSDSGVQVNALFKDWTNPGTTVVQTYGITIGGDQVTVGANGALSINGEIIRRDGTFLDSMVVRDGDKVTIDTGEYKLEFSDTQRGFVNNLYIRSDDANSDHVLPHGLWGASVDGDGQARDGDRGKGVQGGGAIEGLDGKITSRGDRHTVELYEVGGLFDTGFDNFNKFNARMGSEGPGFNALVNETEVLFANLNINVDVAIEAGLGAVAPEAEVQGGVAVEQGRIWGDPHFVGADGGKYDVQGEAGKTYNILSDTGVQMNATFKEWDRPGTTVVENVGLSIGGRTVEITSGGGILIDGEGVAFPAVVGQDFGLPFDLGTKKADGSIEINAGEYTITFSDFQRNAKSGDWINNIEIRSDNANADNVLPHGLWGVTVDGDGQARNGDQGKGVQGGGALENLDGSVTERGDTSAVGLYEVDGLFDTSFDNFNRFSGQPGFGAKLDGTVFVWVRAEVALELSAMLSMTGSGSLMDADGAKAEQTASAGFDGLNITQEELEGLAALQDGDDAMAELGRLVDAMAANLSEGLDELNALVAKK